MERSEVEDLLNRYRIGQTSNEENALVESWYLAQGSKLPASTAEIDYEAKKKQLWEGILHQQNSQQALHRKLWLRLAAAASIIGVLSFGAYLFSKKDNNPQQTTIAVQHDITPGGNKAILTLSNGSQIALINQISDTIATQGTTVVTKNRQGTIIYNTSNNIPKSALSFNTITTPKGGEYQVILPDGTHVWLNAASSLIYPVAFVGNDRKVELTGEAYFEVAHDKEKPFRVTSGGQTVEVIGTHFNINAYTDEQATTTTLLEGSVKISEGLAAKLLKPGEQAIVKGGISVLMADVDAVIAWKNGRTYFKDAEIPTIMRAIGRWYNIEVVYRGEPSKELFTGGISRKSNLSSLLKILSSGGIHAVIEDNKLIVKP